MNLRWFTSRTVRVAGEMHKHVRKILSAQRDILSPQAVTAVQTALDDTKKAMAGADGEALQKQMDSLEKAANKWLKPYPNATARENVEVLLVALTVAMGIRTFIVQPFKIPTGSMQPTLFGVTSPGNQLDLKIPNRIARFFDYWINGNSYYEEIAPSDGQLEAVRPPTKLLLFNVKQEYEFNGQWHTIWFPADDLFQHARLQERGEGGGLVPHFFKAGEPILRLKVTAGDHLFVDRISYNFRHPKRGEIIVFETRGIGNEYGRLPEDQFYIKRLVALGGEQVQIGDDRHLVINGQRLDKSTPHFEKVYSFDPNQPPMDSHYSGHLNQTVANSYGMTYPPIAPLFPDATTVYTVRPEHYMVMGDNTASSYDSRVWGNFSRTNVIGKNFFVYWPFSERFGLKVR